MAKYESFNGKNSLGTKNLFNERLRYEIGIFDESLPPKPINQFYFGEFQYYGKVDEQLNSIIANKQKLKLISTKDNFFAFDFVKNQFDALKQNFVQNTTIGNINKNDQFLSSLKCFKAYESFDSVYNSYIKSVLTTLNKTYIIDGNRINNIKDFSSYVDYLIEFSKISSKILPLTKTAFLKTNFCPLNVSGLVIEIANLKYSEDQKKLNFYESQNFEFFRKACIKHGFFIDYNAPWRLIADIDSPPMINAMKKLNYSRDTIFFTHFSDASQTEISNIKDIIYGGYSVLIKNRPFSRIISECNGRLVTEIFERQQITKNFVNEKIDDNTALKLYLNIRASEQENEIQQNVKNNIFSNSLSIKNKSGLNSSINYIEQQLRPKELVGSGTINTRVLNLKKSKQEG